MNTHVCSQPYAISAPLVAPYNPSDEKGWTGNQLGDHRHACEAGRGRCAHHRARSRRILVTIALFLFSILLLLVLSCLWDAAYNNGSWFSDGADGVWGSMTGLVKRQSQSDGSSGNQTPFVRNKLYLIVLFVGLFVCLVLAIMLAAWCCRGAFNNPLCCPCYCCALCGGLACLECISCGLCAEAAEQF